MDKLKIMPSKIKGEINVPPSKSLAHRAVICASLCQEESIISNIDFSDDIIATIDIMRKLGASIDIDGSTLTIKGGDLKADDLVELDCNESGSTLRFCVPISLVKENKVVFLGRGNLGKRPLTSYFNIFDKQDIKYENRGEELLDLLVSGNLKNGEFSLEGNISSQFISGLLFSLPLLDGDSKIIITTNLESKGYVDLTLDMLNRFGIEIINNDYKEFVIKGNQSYKSANYTVEADFSQVAFFAVGSYLGNEIDLLNLNLNSLQGDKEVIDIVKAMGADVTPHENGKVVIRKNEQNQTVIDGSQCPDVIPVVVVGAALTEGETKIINIERLRIKECDRITAITTELNKLGADVTEGKDYIIVKGKSSLKGGHVSSWGDHRIAMSMAIASTRCIEPVILEDFKCVKKSYPGFWNDFKKLGGEFCEWSMGN